MNPEAFAAERHARLTTADEMLEPFVREALNDMVDGQEDWSEPLVAAASRIWYENFQAEAPGAPGVAARRRFETQLHEHLAKTTDYGEVSSAQVDRVTQWLSTYAVNAGTTAGAFQKGVRFKRWTTMQDAHVRDIHAPLDGQIKPIGGTFDVAGSKLGYPGEPVGPPEVWINCRCVAMPASREGEAMSANTYAIGPEDEVEDNPDIVIGSDVILAAGDVDAEPVDAPADDPEMPPDEPEEGEDLITEVPVHGVSIVEGRPTGDGRGFRNNALSFDDVPQPLGYEFEHGHGSDNSRVAIVGRIDEIFRVPLDDETSEVRWRGAIILTRDYAAQALESIIDGSYNGSSVIIDDVTIDVEEMKEDFRRRMAVDSAEGDEASEDDLVDLFIGDGKQSVTWISQARQRRLDMVPTGAFIESRIGLGHAFEDELTEADIEALTACGCLDEFREVDTEERKRLADEGAAMPDGSYPIANCDDLRNAIQAIGRASDPEATKAHIRKRKSALGCDEVELPEDWAAEVVTAAAGTKDGPGWITHPVATKRIRDYWVRGEGAAKIRWGVGGDFNRCRMQLAKYVQNPDWLAGLCANMHHEALGIWPATHAKEHAVRADAAFAVLASAATSVYEAALFAPPELDHAAPVRIDRDTRRIYGYLAEWGVCHVGITGFCQDVPQSFNDYAYFLKGRVQTDDGPQRVGTLTYGIGHASTRLRAAAATAHYDQTDAVRAYVNMGEDVLGIWFSGVLAPWVTEADMDAIEAIGAFSGDWRDWGQGSLDLIGAVCVNTPGFQLVASGGEQTAIIGTNVNKEEAVVASANMTVNVAIDADMVGAIARTAVAEYRHLEKVEARVRPARDRVRQYKITEARKRVERGR